MFDIYNVVYHAKPNLNTKENELYYLLAFSDDDEHLGDVDNFYWMVEDCAAYMGYIRQCLIWLSNKYGLNATFSEISNVINEWMSNH